MEYHAPEGSARIPNFQMSNYSIQKVPVRKLNEIALTALTDKEHFSFLPISPERALAQSKNPAASKDDIGLILIYDGNKCIGYRGILPCWVKAEGKIHKVYVASSMYVAPEYRRKYKGEYTGKLTDNKQTITEYTLTENTDLGYDFITTGLSENIYRFHSRFRLFRPVPPLLYLRINIGWINPFSSLFKKLLRIKALKPSINLFNSCSRLSRRTFDSLITLLLGSSIIPDGCEYKPGLEIIQVDEVLPLEKNFEDSQSEKAIRLYRDESIVNWMIQNSWIKEDEKYIPDYYFAKKRERFDFMAYHLVEKKNRKRVGYAVFSVSTEKGYTTLKILDYKILEKKYLPCILKLALDISKSENANVIEGAYDFWSFLKDKPLLKMITKQIERHYFVWGRKDGIFEKYGYNIKLDYCDCDKPFT